ncbi:hypothetical protein AB0I30_31025 [Nocardia tengchongensis]|uniref:hypothetical protein n=1 Tax=Nocardia tengchongensis TaxID=2055889 RepID=UPI0033CABCCD
MLKHWITVVAIAVAAVTVTGCGDHRSTPLTPPAPSTSAPVMGGGELPDVIDVPASTATPSSTLRPTKTH